MSLNRALHAAEREITELAELDAAHGLNLPLVPILVRAVILDWRSNAIRLGYLPE